MYTTTTLSLTPDEIDLVIDALHESAEDRQQFDEIAQAARFTTLLRKFVKAQSALITH